MAEDIRTNRTLDRKMWGARERHDILFRLDVMKAVGQFAIAWCVLTAVFLTSAQAGFPWIFFLVLALVAIGSFPVALADMMMVVDAALHVLTGRSYFVVAMLKSMAAEGNNAGAIDRSQRTRLPALIVSVLSWGVPWRPLSKVAAAYLGRTAEVVRASAALHKSKRAQPAAVTTKTQEMVAVTRTSRALSYQIEGSVVSQTFRRTRPFDLAAV
jgi:hypothetical protein